VPKWQALNDLLESAKDAGLAVYDKLAPQVKAISEGRQLLADPDMAPVYIKELANSLTAELKARHAAASAVHEEQAGMLAATPEWTALGTKDRPTRDNIAETRQLRPLPEVHAGDADLLVNELRRCPLSRWKDIAQALPTRFSQARSDAARALLPKAIEVRLPSATISTPAELDAWLTQSKAAISKVLEQGNPVIV